MDIFTRKILLVDDHQELRNMTRDILNKNGFSLVVTADSYRQGYLQYQKEKPDLAILDIMLPDGNGYALFQEIRKDSEIPILFLSAKDEDADRLMGLGLGADDYITKPFLPQELVLRVSAVLKRTYGTFAKKEPVIEDFMLGDRRIDLNKGYVAYENQEIPFTATEIAILEKLYQNRGNIVTFDAICQTVWNEDYYGFENTLMVHIRHLRQKIETDPSHPKWLATVRGVGYRLVQEAHG